MAPADAWRVLAATANLTKRLQHAPPGSRKEESTATMEEDPTPVPSVGLRKHLITNDEGVITGEETSVDLGHTESGQVPGRV